jgi:cell wall-associated NlpC family hydrolase
MKDHRKVTRGTHVNIAARLTDHRHGRRGGVVRFYKKAGTQRHWHLMGRAKTSRRGWAHLEWVPEHNARWKSKVTPTERSGVIRSRVQHARARSLGQSAIRLAAEHRGDPYSYGSAGPHRFDCSGFTMFIYAKLNRSLPHNSAAQYGRVRHISRSHKRVGDLLFFYEGGGIHHVGIYAGHGMMWHAPRTGENVHKASIYSRSYYVGRV